MSVPKAKPAHPNKEKKPPGKLVEAPVRIPPEGYINWDDEDIPALNSDAPPYDAVCKEDMQIATAIMWTTKLQSIKQRLLKYGLRCMTGPDVKFVQNFDRHHKEHMRETFDFANDEESFQSIYSAFLKKLSGVVSHLDSIFVDSSTIQILFPLPILKMYVERLYNRPGYWLYDEVQRGKFVFMSLLMTHHLLSDTKYHLRVDTQAIKMMDPVLRGIIRRQNREDPFLRKKYLDSGLQLKEFVKDLLATYFLNQNFRYISSNGFTHEHVLKLIRVALELGFYEAHEILSLLRTISLRIHCLFLAESALLGELAAGAPITYYNSEMYAYARFFWRCRQETLKIVLHSITLINDEALEQSVNILSQNRRKLDFEDCFDQAFFNNTELSNYVYAIVTKLMPQKLVQDFLSSYFETHPEFVNILKDETREYTKLFEEVFMLIISKDKDSMTSSFGLVDQAVIDFHLQPKSKSISEDYMPLAKKLRTNFIQVFEDLKIVTLSDSPKVKAIVDRLLIDLKTLEEKKDSLTSESQELKMFSISLASQNVEMIMLYIATILDGYTSLVDKSLEHHLTDALYLMVFLISKTATTPTNQSLLFGELGWKLITRLLETRPLLIVASIERIFTKRREIFNNEPDIFGKLVSIYRKLLSEVEDLVEDLTIELSGSGLVSVDPKLAAENMGTLSEAVAGKLLNSMVKSVSRSEQPPDDLEMKKAVSSSPEDPVISKLTLKEKMNKLVALQIYCRCLSGLVPHFDNGVKYSTNYDLNLLHVIEPVFIKIVLPKLILNPEIRQIGLKRLDMGFLRFHKVNDVLKFTTSDKIVTKEEVAAVMYEFGLSFLHLFNSCTSRIYYGTTAMKVCALIQPTCLVDMFQSLENSVRGINLRQQLLQLVTNFFIFQRNHTISKREGAGETDFLADVLNYYEIYMKAEIQPDAALALIEAEFNFVRNWARKHLSSRDQTAKEHAEQYVFKGLFPLVFKYARGLLATVTTASQDYQNSFDYINGCLDALRKIYDLVEVFIHDARENYGLTLSLSMLDALTRSVTTGAHTLDGASPQRAISSFIPEVMPTVAPAGINDSESAGLAQGDMSEAKELLGKITQKPTSVDPATPSNKLRPENQSDLEPDELVCPELAALRSIARTLCRTIETNYPVALLRYIESFDRLNALKRKKSKLDELFLKKAEHSSSKKYDLEYRRQRRADIEAALRSKSGSLLQQFKAVCEVYELKKSEWVELDTKQNSFYSFLDKRPSTTQDLANYIFNTLDNILRIIPETVVPSSSTSPLEGFGCFMCRKMFTTKIPLSLVSFLSFMFRRVSSFRTYLFKEIEKDDFVNPTAEVFAKIFWALMQLVRFLYGKTFHGETYLEFKKIFEELCTTLFSFVEQNRKPIKRLVASHTFVFRLKTTADLDEGVMELDLLMQFYTALARTFHISEVVNLSKTSSLMMVEMPENIFVVQALVHLVREICSGPYLPAQDQLYRFDHDKLAAVAFRSLEDVDSNFYNMQMDMLQYCATLTEGISKDQENQEDEKEVYTDMLTGARISAQLAKAKMVSLLTATFREDLIAKMIVKSIKKLFIYTLIKTQPPGFKAKPIEKLKQDLQKKKAAKEREQKEFELKSKEIQSKFRKGVDFYRTRQSDKHIMEAEIKKIEQKLHKVDTAPTLESVFESYDSLVYEELEDIIKITDYRQILDFYVRYPIFSEHSLLKIALKLYTITHNFSKFSENFQLRIRERSRMLYAYFGQEVPLILIGDIDLSDIDPLNSKNAPEDINVFMFLAKISMQVEVNIPSSVGLNLQMISFQIHPMSFELTHNTKMNFLNKADSANIVQEFLQNYRYFEIEMRHNLDRRQKHPIKYFFGKKEHQTVMRYSLWVAGLIMNILLLIDARRDSQGRIQHLFLNDEFFNALGALIGVFALILFLIYMMSRYKEIVEIYTIKRREIHGAKQYRFYDYYYIYFKMPFLHKGTPLQLFFHMLLAVLGPTTSFFFHTVHPLLVIFLSNTSFKVLQSITTYPRQLMTTLLLGVFAISSFAYLVFQFYNKDWDSLVDNDGTIEMCKDMWECIFYSVNLGFRSGLGNQFGTPVSHGQTGYFFGRLIFSVTFNILINIIWINIFSGIIIDTFADKRDEEDRRKLFQLENCLICMQSRETIEKRETSFYNHIELKHDLWKYVHYMIFLSRKDPNTFSAVENSIYHTIMEDSTDWIPTNKITERIDFKLDKLIQGVSQAVGTLTNNLEELSEAVDKHNVMLRDATETDKEKQERLAEEAKQQEERKQKELAKIELREKQLKERNKFMDVYREEIYAGKKSRARSDKKPAPGVDPKIEKPNTERSDKPERTASLKPSEKEDDSEGDSASSSY